MLQFIFFGSFIGKLPYLVSIHLMLQFIAPGCTGCSFGSVFQYISCCSLSASDRAAPMGAAPFQYISCCSLSEYKKQHPEKFEDVSIHLMLQFIKAVGEDGLYFVKFQYISCCSLSKRVACATLFPVSFNTSHVVVYHKFFIAEEMPYKFQYISCCSLSQTGLQVCYQQNCFNTSHVVVYHRINSSISIPPLFQYISCCSLSRGKQFPGYDVSRFQYISCCSLSPVVCWSYILNYRFNTSHVVVYLLHMTQIEFNNCSFNTSHVVVYHETQFNNCIIIAFQYISCCSLSPTPIFPFYLM